MPTDLIFNLINQEAQRQQDTIQLIPSENIASPQVHQAVGSVLMHKYAEGYPGKRYYQGNQYVDEVERLCQQRALAAFNLDEQDWGVNVQSYSGSGANLAVYDALLQPGDTIMAMYLPDGGHLSHGWGRGEFKTHVKKIYDIQYYHVDAKTEVFDYDQLEAQAKQVKPKLIISGGTAYPREIDHQRLADIAHSVGSWYHADIAHEGGLVAAGAHPSPFAFADTVMLTTHKTLRGPRGALVFGRKSNPIDDRDLIAEINRSIFPGMQGGPHLHSIAGIAVALVQVQTPQFMQYAQQVVKNAQLLADKFVEAGYHVLSGGTDKHLVLMDVRSQGIEAWLAAWALEYAGIILNRNTIPGDPGSPFYPSGIRLGTPIVTTRGMKESEMEQIFDWIHQVFEYSKQWQLPTDNAGRREFIKQFKADLETDQTLAELKVEVTEFAQQWPVFSWNG